MISSIKGLTCESSKLPLDPKIPANIHLDEDVLKTTFRLRLQKMSSRRLDQDEYIRLSHTSSEDVFKTSWSRPIYSSWLYVFKTSCENVFTTSSRRLQDILKKSSKRLQDIFKTSCKDVFKTFSRRIIKLNSYCKHVFETYSTRFFDVLQRRLSTGRFA